MTTAPTLGEILRLEPHGADTFVGTGPRYPWGGLYGGQILAQALRAASETVEPGRQAHSLRAYFIRPGDHSEPVRYEVDRLRNGRSYTTRRVVARQAIGAILNLEASFTAPGGDERNVTRVPMPDVPRPDELPVESWLDIVDRRTVPYRAGSGEAEAWLRVEGSGDDLAALAFMSDDVPSEAIRTLLTPPGGDVEAFGEDWFMVSLDHTIWFHEPFEAHRWHLHAFTCDRFVNGRGVTHGRVWSEDGRHVASVAQEMLVRRRRRE